MSFFTVSMETDRDMPLSPMAIDDRTVFEVSPDLKDIFFQETKTRERTPRQRITRKLCRLIISLCLSTDGNGNRKCFEWNLFSVGRQGSRIDALRRIQSLCKNGVARLATCLTVVCLLAIPRSGSRSQVNIDCATKFVEWYLDQREFNPISVIQHAVDQQRKIFGRSRFCNRSVGVGAECRIL